MAGSTQSLLEIRGPPSSNLDAAGLFGYRIQKQEAILEQKLASLVMRKVYA